MRKIRQSIVPEIMLSFFVGFAICTVFSYYQTARAMREESISFINEAISRGLNCETKLFESEYEYMGIGSKQRVTFVCTQQFDPLQ